MMTIASVRKFLALTAIAVSFSAYAAHASLGFSVSVATDGFFSSTLKQVKITAVVPGGPAEAAGLLTGDDVESVNEVAVIGTSGSKIMDIVHAVQPGEHLLLKVHRNGTDHLVDIVGGSSK